MASDTTTAAAAAEEAEAVEEYDSDPDEVKRSLAMRRREASDEEVEEDKDSELPIVQSVHIPAGEAEAVDEYESDPDEVKHSLVMRRREASDDEEDDKEFEHRTNSRVHIHSYDESDGQGGAPAEYDDDDDEEEHDRELEEEEEEEEEEGDVYEDEEEEEIYEEEESIDGAVKVKGIEGNDVRRSTEGAVEVSAGNNDNGNGAEKNDAVEEGMEEEKKESNEPFAVPTAGAFYMHDDRFRENVAGRHRRTHCGRRLWESKDDRKWGHDKFEEMNLQERHYNEGRRASRGRYRGRGKNRGSDQAYPRGNRSKAFNNNNNNQSQAPKSVRGRGPRKYEPARKNSNHAPPPRNKQLGKPLEKTSHTNSGRAFTPTSNSESDTASNRKQVFASSLSSASPPFYPSGSSNKDINLTHKKDVQSGSTSRNLRNSSIDESLSVQHANTMQRGKNIADVCTDRLYINDSSSSSVIKPLDNLQIPPSQSRPQGRGVDVPQQIAYQPAPPHNQANRASLTQQLAVRRSPGQNRIQTSVQSATQWLGQHSASSSQASSPPKSASALNSNNSGEVESPSESSNLKSALAGKGKGSQGRGSFLYGGAPVIGAAGNMSVGHGDQNFPAFLPVMQFGGQHPGGMGVPAVGMAFPGYVAQPQLGMGNSEMTWLPVLAGAAGALGATYCPPYLAVDNAYNVRPAAQTSAMASSSKENNTNKPEGKPSQRPGRT
ncbi:protein MLN51-like [Citrus sinensis]|uniref:Protein MLN51-like n=1 Tax=Citrus sinensis TaxID=2711 RepID=A0ACB8JAU5_CITSI|nr:protein MLN51-like [Citrus sinensis]